MRLVKEAEERRNEILDTVERLFGEKGFDRVIAKAVGGERSEISKET